MGRTPLLGLSSRKPSEGGPVGPIASYPGPCAIARQCFVGVIARARLTCIIQTPGESSLKTHSTEPRKQAFRDLLLSHARHSLRAQHLSRITRCLENLSEKQIWWRPHPTSNSVGNLVLHRTGNIPIRSH